MNAIEVCVFSNKAGHTFSLSAKTRAEYPNGVQRVSISRKIDEAPPWDSETSCAVAAIAALLLDGTRFVGAIELIEAGTDARLGRVVVRELP